MPAMHRSSHTPFGFLLLAFLALFPRAASGAAAPDIDEQVLRHAKVSSDGPALLRYLREQCALADRPEQITALIRQLGHDEFAVREKASHALIALGRAAVPLLDAAKKDRDPEIVHRASNCIRAIEQGSVAALPLAVVRVIARKKPAGAAAGLLDYLPHADRNALADEVRRALAAVAVRDGQVDPALKAALTDPLPARRSAAAEVLCQVKPDEARAAVRPLLKDADLTVRLRVALALAAAQEKAAIPVLIELLGRLPAEDVLDAEDILLQVAGKSAPAVVLGTEKGSGQKCHDAWERWWKAQGEKIDLTQLKGAAAELGFTVVVLLDDDRVMEPHRRDRVMELDRHKHVRWQIDSVRFPLDVQVLPRGLVLVAEQKGDRVTERDRKGNVVWEYQIHAPIVAQRLPNGNTFIASQTGMIEVDRAGKEVHSYPPPGGALIMRAQKLPNGDIACVTNFNRFIRMDASGRELSSFPVNVATSGGRIDVLPNGNVLVPQMYQNEVTEFDAAGRQVWRAGVSQPIAAVRLKNGNTIVTSMTEKRAVELDRKGKEVWTYKNDIRVTRALRR
jgi:hypothetical protein